MLSAYKWVCLSYGTHICGLFVVVGILLTFSHEDFFILQFIIIFNFLYNLYIHLELKGALEIALIKYFILLKNPSLEWLVNYSKCSKNYKSSKTQFWRMSPIPHCISHTMKLTRSNFLYFCLEQALAPKSFHSKNRHRGSKSSLLVHLFLWFLPCFLVTFQGLYSGSVPPYFSQTRGSHSLVGRKSSGELIMHTEVQARMDWTFRFL